MSEDWAVHVDIQSQIQQNESSQNRVNPISEHQAVSISYRGSVTEYSPRRKCRIGCSQVFEMFVVFLEFEWLPVRYRFSMCIVSLFIHITSIIISLIYTSYLKEKDLIFLCCFPEATFILATFTGYMNVNKDHISNLKICLCCTGVLLKLITVKSIIYVINICSIVTLFFYYSYIQIKYLINRDNEIQPIISDEDISNIRRSLELNYENIRGITETRQVATRIQTQAIVNEYYEKIKILDELEKNKIMYDCKSHNTETGCEECLCCVCIESKNNKEVYKFVCKHDIHIECMIEFVSKNKLIDIKCPLCRQNL